MLQETQEKVREIKRSFRQLMNGVTSQSMREKGLSYKINWGVAYTDLKNMAAEYGKDYSLAIELWKENIRECKILATMIMPPEEMSAEVVDLWLEQAPTQEIVEMLAFNLLQHLPYVPVMAYEWIASDIDLRQIAGYLVLARLFMRGETPDERGMNDMMAMVHIYYTVDLVISGGQGFCDERRELKNFEYKHEAQQYAVSIESEYKTGWGHIEIVEHIER